MEQTGIPTFDMLPSPVLSSFANPPPRTPDTADTGKGEATTSVIDDIVAYIRAYHDGERSINEEQNDQAEGEAEEILEAYHEREVYQSELEQRLEAELQTLKERRGILEKAIRILQDNMASVDCAHEHVVRSQEKARAQKKLDSMEKSSDLEEYRRNMVERYLSQSVSRRTKLIKDITYVLGDDCMGSK